MVSDCASNRIEPFLGEDMNIKKLILAVALATAVTNVPTYAIFNDDCCQSSCYECGCNPLYCGAWSLQVQGGVAPIVWRHRGELDLVSCASNDVNPIFALSSELPKFNKLFRVPWIVGGKVGYDFTDNVEVYVEFNYLQAKHKDVANATFPILNVAGPITRFAFHKYKLFDAYVGARYYWDRWCDRVAFFLGGQVGLTSHRSTKADITLNGSPVVLVPAVGSADCPRAATTTNARNHFFAHNTVISGGANLGFDVCFCGNWSLVVTGEIIASCGPKTHTTSTFAALLPAPTLASNLIVGCFGTELRFPVTAGLRYTF